MKDMRSSKYKKNVKPTERIELSAYTLRRCRSTTELCRRLYHRLSYQFMKPVVRGHAYTMGTELHRTSSASCLCSPRGTLQCPSAAHRSTQLSTEHQIVLSFHPRLTVSETKLQALRISAVLSGHVAMLNRLPVVKQSNYRRGHKARV